jgi:hypothetical protein
MAIVIPPGTLFGDSVSQNAYGFEYLGNLYLFTWRGDSDVLTIDNQFRCLKSADGGATWTEIVGPQWPFTLGGTLNAGWDIAFTVARDGASVILLWVNATKDVTHFFWSGFTISKVVFDLVGGSWGSVSTTAAPFIDMMDTTDSGGTGVGDHSNRCTIHLIVRGPGDYLVYVPGAMSGTLPAQRGTATVVTYNGSTFGSAMPIPGQVGGRWYQPCGSVYDPASGNTHFLMVSGGSQSSLHHVAMDSGNSYGTTSLVIDSSVSPGDMNAGQNTGPDGVSQPIIYLDGATRKVAFVSSVFGVAPYPIFVRFFSATETLNPTFTQSDISTDQAVVPLDIPHFASHAEMFSLAANSNTLIVTWVSFTGSFSYDAVSDVYSTTSPATGTPVWTTPVSVIPTPAPITTISGLSAYVNVQGLAFPMAGGFGVVGHAQQLSNFPPFLVTQFSFVSAPSPPTIECGDPPDGAVGTPYDHTLPTTHGGTFTVAITGGALPDGLTMSSSGEITGTPALAGDFDFTAEITTPGSPPETASVACAITITGTGPVIECDSPPDGDVGEPYSHHMLVSAGTVTLTGGALPPGLSISSSGLITGVPTLPGTFSFTVKTTV